MGELSAEARTRIRAVSLQLVGALTLALVLVVGFAALVGFERPASVVLVVPAGRQLVVEYATAAGGCPRAESVEVIESDDVVVLTATARHTLGRACEPTTRRTVVDLAAPLGDRQVREGAPGAGPVPVRDEGESGPSEPGR